MWRVLSSVSIAVMLSGCATQFGTRTVPAPVMYYKAAPAPSMPTVAAPVAPVAAPVAPETFKKRWMHKFFIKRATEK